MRPPHTLPSEAPVRWPLAARILNRFFGDLSDLPELYEKASYRDDPRAYSVANLAALLAR